MAIEGSPIARVAALLAAFCGVATLAMLAFSFQTATWYSAKANETSYTMGMFDYCVNKTCKEIEFNASVTCGDVSGSDLRLRYWVSRGLYFLEGVGAFALIIAATVACQRGATGGSPKVLLAVAVVSAFSGGAGSGLYGVSVQSFFFCGKEFCESLSSATGCSEKLDFSFIVAAASTGPCLVAGVLAVVLLAKRSKVPAIAAAAEGAAATEPIAAAGGGTGSPEGESSTAVGGSPEGGEQALADDVVESSPSQELQQQQELAPEGDWIWDEESGMWWSESAYLFMNPANGYFFDPRTMATWNGEQWIPYSGEDDGDSGAVAVTTI